MNTPGEQTDKAELIRLLEKATEQQLSLARASYCLERAVRRIAEGMTDAREQSLRETLLNAVEFARGKLPEVPDDLPRAREPVVSGRDLTSPCLEFTASLTCVQIRVDDESNPSFWLQLVVPVWLLYQQLAHVELLKQRHLAGDPSTR